MAITSDTTHEGEHLRVLVFSHFLHRSIQLGMATHKGPITYVFDWYYQEMFFRTRIAIREDRQI